MKKKFLAIPILLVLFFLVNWRVISAKLNFWDGKRQFNMALLSKDNLILLSLNPEQKTAFKVSFPSTLLVETFGNYGALSVGKINELALQEKKQEILPKTIEYYFGFPLDFWVFLEKGSGEENLGDLKKELKKLPFSQTKLSIIKRVNLWRVNNRWGSSRLLEESWQGEKEFSNQKKDFFELDREKWDNWASLYLADPVLRDEQVAIGIYNIAGIKGLAADFARILTNSGMLVTVVGDSDLAGGSCLLGLRSEEERETWTHERLLKIIPDCQEKVLTEEDFSDSTRINIYLGENFIKMR